MPGNLNLFVSRYYFRSYDRINRFFRPCHSVQFNKCLFTIVGPKVKCHKAQIISGFSDDNNRFSWPNKNSVVLLLLICFELNSRSNVMPLRPNVNSFLLL